MSAPAVLFDLDGTLVDTTVLHTLAWWRALEEAGEHAPTCAVQPLIGLASRELLTTLIGREDDGISDRHGEHFASMHPCVRALPGAADLLRRVHGLGGQVVVVTSAKDRDLGVLLGALGCEGVVDEVVNEVAGSGKPAPDMVTAALARVGCEPDRALFVGDSVWDVLAARRAGVAAVGVETGGTAGERLSRAGAAAVYETCSEILDVWPATPLGALLAEAGLPAAAGGPAGTVAEPVVTASAHGPDVTVQLTTEHRRVRRLLADLVDLAPPARREALLLLGELIARHETAEQSAVHPVLAQEPGGRELRDEALAQERELSRSLIRLMRLGRRPRPLGGRFAREHARLVGLLDRHVDFEEQRVMPLLRAAEGAGKRQMMGAWVSQAEAVAPLRPHPHAPQRLPGLLAFGPLLALGDRLRRRARRLGRP